MRSLIFVLAAGLWTVGLSSPVASAQASRELAEKHPAAQVVVKFLRNSVNREYDKAADLIVPASLETLKTGYVAKVKSPRVGLDQVTAMCQAVGVADERGIEAMTPRQFYAAYNQGMQRRYNVTDEVNRRIADSLELNMLSVAEEGPALVHFLVRTEHRTLSNKVSHLEIISLMRVNNQWMVSLDEQEPKYTPLTAAAPPAVSPGTAPTAVSPPAQPPATAPPASQPRASDKPAAGTPANPAKPK